MSVFQTLSLIDMNPEILIRISGFLFMSKLSKQDKIDIYNNWKNYNISANQAAKEYGANRANLFYLITLIERHGIEILDTGYTNYSVEFKEKAIRRVLFNHEAADQVSLELGLSSRGMIYNWIRKYKEDGHNVINHKKGRPAHEGQRQIKDLKQKNLRLTVENEFVKKLNALVSQRTRDQQHKK